MTTTNGISPLRQRMIEDMVSRRLSKSTQIGHIRACKRFAAWLKRSPDTATVDEVRLTDVVVRGLRPWATEMPFVGVVPSTTMRTSDLAYF